MVAIKGNIILWLMILLSACSDRQSSSTKGTSLIGTGSIYFPIDELTFYRSKAIFQFEDGRREYLFFENSDRGKLQLHIFDIKEQALFKSIPMYKEGPNGMVGIFGGWPIDMNNFLITTKTGRFHLIDDKGDITKTFRAWEKGKFGIRYGNISVYSYFSEPAILKDSLFYFAQSDIGYPHKKEDWSKTPMFAYANLKDGTLNHTELYFPDIFAEDEKYRETIYSTSFSYAFTGKQLAVSFKSFDSIMVTSDFKNTKFYNARSRYAKPQRPEIENLQIDLTTKLKRQLLKPSYHHLIYDKYRDVFYRFVLLPCELTPDLNPYDEISEQEFSIIILNNKYEIIGETKFPGNTYCFRMCFVGKEGLYISLNNQKNPDFNENELKFKCFKLQDK